jgi:hypothetical protein
VVALIFNKGEVNMAKSVKGTKTETCLKDAFAGESKANRRYLYFANMADVAGAPMWQQCSAPQPKVKQVMRTDTWST